MNSFYKYFSTKNTMAMSIASTWAWAPSIYVASSQGYFNGIYGLLWFAIPNILTLIVFGYFASLIREKSNIDNLTLYDYVESKSIKQAKLHRLISLVVLTCSTIVQFLGLHVVLHSFLGISQLISSIICTLVSLAVVAKDGFKASVITDKWKYIIMVIVGATLAIFGSSSGIVLEGYNKPSFMTITTTFGLTTMLGLMSAPYCDQTFWQRLYSTPKEDVKDVFTKAAIFFAFVPITYGLVGLSAAHETGLWNIVDNFKDNSFFSIILSVSILCALLSTLDSNLCALSSYFYYKGKETKSVLPMVILLAICTIISTADLTITGLFLIYGTIRGSSFIPTILMLYDKYNETRLLYLTSAAVLIGGIGFIATGHYLFTVLAVFLPLLAYKK